MFLRDFLHQSIKVADDAGLVGCTDTVCAVATHVVHERNVSLSAISIVSQFNLDIGT